MSSSIEEVVIKLREAIQEAEEFGLIYTDKGQVVTGAMIEDGSIILTED